MTDDAPPQQGGAEPGAAKRRKLNPKRRKKLQAANSTDPLPESEQQRRERQRKLRELALTLRDHGRTYHGPWQLDKKRPGDHSRPPAAKKQRGDLPNVIVLPIYWNQRVDEKAAIMQAANQAVQLLTEAGIGAMLDVDDEHTPGQRMRFWEVRGVKCRLEVGPKEALAGTVVLAMAKAPGEVADKRSVKNKANKLVGGVRRALTEAGVDIKPLSWQPARGGQQEQQQEGDPSRPQQADEEVDEEEQAAGGEAAGTSAAARPQVPQPDRVKHKKKAAAGAAGGEQQQQQQQQPAAGRQKPAPARPARAVKPVNPDALADDFNIVSEVEEPGEKKKGKFAKLKEKKKALKAAKAAAGTAAGTAAGEAAEAAPEAEAAAQEQQQGKKQQKQQKVVAF